MVNREYEKNFYITGYVGEGAKRMLMDLENMENVALLDKAIGNRWMRFLYYRCERMTNRFSRFHWLKFLFYPWFSILHCSFRDDMENIVVFFNSGFCQELDLTVVDRLRKKNQNIRLVLYIVDPMSGFDAPEHMAVIDRMDLVYSINKVDCAKYGFCYYPLVYSRENTALRSEKHNNDTISDLYYLGSGTDRTELLKRISQKCNVEGIKTDFHVLSNEENKPEQGIRWHERPVPYTDNIRHLLGTNCILEIMHEAFDNPTQRYSEALVYNKKLLTNNDKIVTFEFYDPEYMRVFQTVEDIDVEFVKSREKADYGYQDEFSPRLLLREIADRPDLYR